MPENTIDNVYYPVSAKSLWKRAKKSFVGWRLFFGEHSWLLVAVNVVFFLLLFCFGFLSGPFKRKMYDQIEKVCIGNNQRIDSWKSTSTETLDKNKRKILILVFRCWHYKNKRTKSAEIVWGNEWNVYFQ